MHVVVCGAGIAGLTLALQLHRQGTEVTVVEAAPGPRTEGWMLDFFGPGHAAAARMGLLPRLQQLSRPVEELVWADARGRPRARVPWARLAAGLDGQLLSLLRPDLERALREQVAGRVPVRHGRRVVGFADGPGPLRVHLDDGTALAADLLVGADGLRSRVRTAAFGPVPLRLLGMHTAAFAVEDPALHAALGRRLWLTDTLDRMLGLYALEGARVAVFTVHRTPAPAPPADARARLRAVFAGLGGLVPAVLARCPPPEQIYCDVVAQVEPPRWSTGRVVLAGDACHAVSLVAGQGASLAVAGAAELARQLGTAPDLPAALAGYERTWRPVAAARQRAGRDGLAWFLPARRTTLWARRAALRLLAVPRAERLLLRGLLGGPDPPGGDLPGAPRRP